jgi:DAACS family dicarboxylate/amino acid:cation (Na+ or H+) symporter
MKLSLHARILLGLAIGTIAGGLAHRFGSDSRWLEWFIPSVTKPIGDIFIRLLLMLVLPLMFSALVLGVAELGDLRRLGRIGIKTLAYTIVVSTIAVLLGVGMVNLFRPGEGLSPDRQAELLQRLQSESERHAGAIAKVRQPPASAAEMIVNIVPNNPIAAAANGDYLAWMFFALMIGIGLCLVKSPSTAQLLEVIRGLFEVCMLLIRMVIWLAPIGVAALLFNLTAQFGWEVLKQLGAYIGVVIAALLIHQFIVYSIAVKALGKMSPARFFREVQEAMVMAFSTASSNATLPTALKVADENLRLPQHISRFVLTVGATANQNGTALFEGVTVLFLAQFYGVELTLAQQFTVVFMCVLGGIGTAGVPAGSLPVIVMIMGMIGVPVEGIGLIIGIDRFLDMCRTTLNVTGDLAAAVVISRSEQAALRTT